MHLRQKVKTEDPDEMHHDNASTLFPQGKKVIFRVSYEIYFLGDIINCDPSNHTMDHPNLIVSNQKYRKKSICIFF